MKTTPCTVELKPIAVNGRDELELRVARPDRPEVAFLNWMNLSVLRGCYPDLFGKLPIEKGAVELTALEMHTLSCLSNQCWTDKYVPKPLPRTEFLMPPRFTRSRRS